MAAKLVRGGRTLKVFYEGDYSPSLDFILECAVQRKPEKQKYTDASRKRELLFKFQLRRDLLQADTRLHRLVRENRHHTQIAQLHWNSPDTEIPETTAHWTES